MPLSLSQSDRPASGAAVFSVSEPAGRVSKKQRNEPLTVLAMALGWISFCYFFFDQQRKSRDNKYNREIATSR